MLNNLINIQISASTVAWYAAIVATVGATVSIYNAWRDRARILITYQKGMKLINVLPPWSEDKEYFLVNIKNQGRRPVKIGNSAIIYFTGETFLLADSISNRENRVLTEENPDTQLYVEQAIIDFSKLHFIQIFDRAGREYRKYLYKFPTFKKYWYKFTHYDKK